MSDNGTTATAPMGVGEAARQLQQLRTELHRVVVGQERVLERVLVALLSGGHCLLQGVPGPFMVLATQNPIESEGVYPLPEAQRDRFLMRIPVDYPTPAEEHAIVSRASRPFPTPDRILTTDDLMALQQAAASVHVDPAVQDYAVRLVLATRYPVQHGLDEVEGFLAYGASPRASIGLVHAGRALALLRRRRRTRAPAGG